MKPREAKQLGAFIRKAREAQLLSQNRLGEAVGVPNTTIMRLERGENLNPRPDLLANIADELGLELADLYSFAGYTTPTSMPTLRPYLRAKYREFPVGAADELEAYAEKLAKRYGVDLNGPAPGEDEEPESTTRSSTKKGGTRHEQGKRTKR